VVSNRTVSIKIQNKFLVKRKTHALSPFVPIIYWACPIIKDAGFAPNLRGLNAFIVNW